MTSFSLFSFSSFGQSGQEEGSGLMRSKPPASPKRVLELESFMVFALFPYLIKLSMKLEPFVSNAKYWGR